MIKVYSMSTCPDCADIERQVRNNPHFKIVDIGKHVKDLKAFIRLRDTNSVFDEAKRLGYIGIPCFVLENGMVTLNPEDAGLQSSQSRNRASCSLDGSGC